jgi:hypothetical protein
MPETKVTIRVQVGKKKSIYIAFRTMLQINFIAIHKF